MVLSRKENNVTTKGSSDHDLNHPPRLPTPGFDRASTDGVDRYRGQAPNRELDVTEMHDVADFRTGLLAWIGEHLDELRPPYRDHGTTEEILDHQRTVQRRLFDEGFMRRGWPPSVGGLGGSPLQRAVLGEELTSRGLVHSSAFSMPEVLGPAVVTFADPELAAEVVPAMLSGDELWCQGFSEPEAGSDLGSMRTTARSEGGDWLITGQKLWTSWAHHASRCIVLARTGSPESGSRGITAFFVDMDSPGITVRPLETMAGVDEFCETYFDEVRVPAARTLGEIGGGWTVAQHILGCERGPIFWQRSAWLLHHLSLLCEQVAPGNGESERAIGEAFADIFALRAQSRVTQYRVAQDDLPGAEASIDKILIATADQALFSAVQQVLPAVIEFDDSAMADRWRKEWLYSRAATIYGGTSEIQRDIVSGRLLGLVRVP
jgi:alkylation response protein AidB-like acyl-CoA dehydrogenase